MNPFLLEIRVLGGLQIRFGSWELEKELSRKASALLAYLACSPGFHSREILATMFWEEKDQVKAHNNLRTTLHSIRQYIGDVLIANRQDVSLDQQAASIWVDSVTLLQQVNAARQGWNRDKFPNQEHTQALQNALVLYQGPFFNGVSIRGGQAYDDWLSSQQAQLEIAFYTGVEILSELQVASGQYEQAIETTAHWLRFARSEEKANQQMVRLLALTGNRSRALAHYESYKSYLAEKLGLSPDPVTEKLYEDIRAGQFGAETSREDLTAISPYKGLLPFTEQDALDFFGRADFVANLVENVNRKPIVTVLGPSGCGKSSVVLAGLVPRLRTMPPKGPSGETRRWNFVIFRPGAHPVQSLLRSLIQLLSPEISETRLLFETRQMTENLRQNQVSISMLLAEIGKKIRERSSGRLRPVFEVSNHLLLVVNQFEELYTLCRDPQEVQAFLDLLIQLVRGSAQPGVNLSMVITLRADFMGQALAYRPWSDVLQNSLLVLGNMSTAELQQAIEIPAARHGFRFQPGLVNRIVSDVGDTPGALPLVQFAMTLLWENRTGDLLTHSAYDAIGGVQGALARYADEVYDHLSPGEKSRFPRIVNQMVSVGEGTEDNRRKAPRHELGEDNWAVVQKLADARLVVTGLENGEVEVAELAHEALIRSWEKVQTLLSTDRSFRIWREELRYAVRYWRQHDYDPNELYRGARLGTALEWMAARPGQLNALQENFLIQSKNKWEKEEGERMQAAEQALQNAREVAETQKNLAQTQVKYKRAWRLSTILSAFFVILLAFLWQNASQNNRLAEASRLALEAEIAFRTFGDPELIALLALEAKNTYPKDDLAGTPIEAALDSATLFIYPSEVYSFSMGLISLDVSPVDAQFAVGTVAGDVWLLDTNSQERFRLDMQNPEGALWYLQFSADGQHLLAAGTQFLRIWNIQAARPVLSLDLVEDSFSNVQFSPEGYLFYCQQPGCVLHDWLNDQPVLGFQSPEFIQAFSKFWVQWLDFGTLAIGDEAGNFIIWDTKTGSVLHQDNYHTASIVGAALSPDKKFLVSFGADYRVVVRDAHTYELVHTLEDHTNQVSRAMFSPDSAVLAVASLDQTISLWDTGTWLMVQKMFNHRDAVNDLVFLPGQPGKLASVSQDARLMLWDLARKGVNQYLGHEGAVNFVTISPDGSRLLSASSDRTARVWDVATARTLTVFSVHENVVYQAAFTGGGQYAVTSSWDEKNPVILWNVETGAVVRTYEGGSALGLAVSSDETLLAAGGWEGDIWIWELQTGRLLHHVKGHAEPVIGLQFLPGTDTLLSISTGSSVKFWNARTGSDFQTLSNPDHSFSQLAVSPNGKRIAVGSYDREIFLWDLDSLKLEAVLTKHDGYIASLSFSQDGTQLLSTSSDKTAVLWSIPDGEIIRIIKAAGSALSAGALHPTQNIIFTAGENQVIQSWPIDLDQTQSFLCQQVWRDFEPSERDYYQIKANAQPCVGLRPVP